MTATANGNHRTYNATPHEKGELQAWWQGPWERNGIRVDVLRRYHRFELAAKAKLDPAGSIFQKLVAGAEIIDQRNGTIRQWRVWQVQEFKLLLGNSGKVRYMPVGWGPRIAAALFHCLVEKLGLTLAEFREFCSRLKLARVEIANQVTENSNGVLVPGKIATVIFEDLPTIPPATIVLKDDLSKGLMELETSGSAPEAEDVHLMVCNPAVAEGYIRQIRDQQQQDAPVIKQIAEQGARAEVNQAQSETHVIREIQKTWHPLSIMNKGIMKTEEKVGQALIALQTIEEKLDKQPDGAASKQLTNTLKIVGSRIVNAINKLGNRFEDQITDVQTLVEEKNTEAELRNTDLSNDIAKHILDVQIKQDCTLDQCKQTRKILEQHASDTEQQHLRQDIRIANVMDQCKEILRQIQKDHQGHLFQTAFLARRMQQLDDRLAGIAGVLGPLAKTLSMTLPDLVKKVAEIRDLIEHLKSQLGGNRIHQDMLNYLSLAYLVLGQFPDLPYRKIAEMLGIKTTRIYGIIGKLDALGLTGREKRVPTIEPLDSVAVGSTSRTANDPIISVGVNLAKTNPRRRPIWHIFRRNRSSDPKIESNEQKPNGDEKT